MSCFLCSVPPSAISFIGSCRLNQFWRKDSQGFRVELTFPNGIIQGEGCIAGVLQMANIAVRALRLAARTQQPFLYVTQVSRAQTRNFKGNFKNPQQLYLETNLIVINANSQGRQLSTSPSLASSYEFIKTDLAGTDNR